MRRAVCITLSKDERATLTKWGRSRTAPARLVSRAKMILLAAKGLENRAIGEEVGVHRVTVATWRRRFAEQRLAGIGQERPGRGRRATKRKHWARTIVEVTLHTTPKDATHWSTRSLAKHLGIDKSMVRRVWRTHELAPHRVRTFKLSRDKRFIEKLVDVVGLYLRPPEHALVLSVDEKSQIQALDRTQPSLPFKKGRCGTITHDYKRNGTTTLFAALNILTGEVLGTCAQRHRHQEWLAFLRKINQSTPKDKDIHIICDNYATHKHPKVKSWLRYHKRFHVHFTPTSASWLNMVERFFRELTDKQLRRGVFSSVNDLQTSVMTFIEKHNKAPAPYIWTKSATDILEKVKRGREKLNKLQTV